ncbi:MAG: tRNA pseudouridine(38-40) synthase TruA [Gemmatimonadaceae bacterium]|nr:tRNA pseudouridine(38-40) synthase TruA [Gemmatimonadaceae bacterium]
MLHYDGTGYSGWQRQPDARTVQGELEKVLERLCNRPVPVLGAGRTDAGVHARGQAAGVIVDERWNPADLRRAMNALAPQDIWVADSFEMLPEFHARYSAVSREYSYRIATDGDARSPFRSRYALACDRPLDKAALDECASDLMGDHCFKGFAVQGTAPESDNHRCTISHARWRAEALSLTFEVRANRFLHHMVRFLVGTMLDIASGKRPTADFLRLLNSDSNSDVSAPAPPHALFLEKVEYPAELYLRTT